MTAWVAACAFLILAVLALRALLGRRVSAGLRYALWAVVLVRLLVPVQLFSSPVAPWGAAGRPGEQLVVDVPVFPVGGTADDRAHNIPALLAASDAAEAPAVLGWVWLGGSAVMALVFLASNLHFYRKLRRVRVPLEGADCPLRVYCADGLPSPCLFGLTRPAVYVGPAVAGDPDMLRHVLAHEYTHYRHGDHIWNLLRGAALCVHWWDPLAWLAAELSRRDGELACDEGALRRLGDAQRAAYGRTLLALLTEAPRPAQLLTCATTMTSGQKSAFDRIQRIARAPKRRLWAGAALVLAAAVACFFAFGSPPGPGDLADLPADLSLTLDAQEDGGDVVRIEGTVDGTELERTIWFSPAWHAQIGPETGARNPLGNLHFRLPLCGQEAGCWLDACWTDERRTAVRVTATPQALISSQFQPGNLSFTVDLSAGGALLELEGHLPKMSPNAPKLTPTRKEALRAGHIAAQLLTAAEEHYRQFSPSP